VKAAVISDLESPDDNPHGFVASAVGTAVCGVLLVPAALVFCRELRKVRPTLAAAGGVAFGVGLTSAIAVGILAPVTHGYTPLHIQLASAAFVGVCGGAWLHLVAARAARPLLLVQLVCFLILLFLCYGPVEFDNSRLLTSLAFWEWVLCLDCGACLWALSSAVERGNVTSVACAASTAR
jgi:hypothetical protein